ncbi:hypothetical protein VPH35_014443 [Triticum aestivum]
MRLFFKLFAVLAIMAALSATNVLSPVVYIKIFKTSYNSERLSMKLMCKVDIKPLRWKFYSADSGLVRRCLLAWGGTSYSRDNLAPVHSVQEILALSMNFCRAKRPSSGIARHGWIKPPADFVAVNVDVSLLSDDERGAIGVVLKDEHGNFIVADRRPVNFICDAATMKTLALRDGLLLA